MVFLTIACGLSILGSSYCHFVRFSKDIGTNFSLPQNLEIGLWGGSGYYYWGNFDGTGVPPVWQVHFCFPYDDEESEHFDTAFIAARVFSILTPIFAILTSAAVCFIGFKNHRICKVLCVPLLYTTVFQGLTLLIFLSDMCKSSALKFSDYFKDQKCELSTGSKVVIVNTLLFLLSTVMLYEVARRAEQSSKDEDYTPGDDLEKEEKTEVDVEDKKQNGGEKWWWFSKKNKVDDDGVEDGKKGESTPWCGFGF